MHLLQYDKDCLKYLKAHPGLTGKIKKLSKSSSEYTASSTDETLKDDQSEQLKNNICEKSSIVSGSSSQASVIIEEPSCMNGENNSFEADCMSYIKDISAPSSPVPENDSWYSKLNLFDEDIIPECITVMTTTVSSSTVIWAQIYDNMHSKVK